MIMGYHLTIGKNIAQWKLFNDVGLAVGDPKDLETIFTSSKLTKKSVEYDWLNTWIGKIFISF